MASSTTPPSRIPTEPVRATLDLHLLAPDGATVAVLAELRYDADDPYAVRVGFHTGDADSDVVEWTFARQLLADGVTHPVGEGDVQVRPLPESCPPAVGLALSSPSGRALFEVPLAGLVQFLTRTYAAVPTGAESEFVDLDVELALLLWSDPEL